MKLMDKLKKEMIGEIYTKEDIDLIMSDEDFHIVNDNINGIYKYTNGKCQVWFYVELDNGECLVENVVYVTKEDGETRVDPFHTFEDYKAIQDWLWENKKYHHWLACALMASIGRRVGDTVRIKWSHLVNSKGEFRKKLYIQEEKTGKTPAPIINEYAKQCVLKYCDAMGIDLVEAYKTRSNVFNVKSPAVRAAIKLAIDNIGIIDYPVSCHSYRKWYANQQLKLHPNDPWAMRIIMEEMGHYSEEMTRKYLNFFDDKKMAYQDDYANYMIAKESGEIFEIDNSPTVTLRGTNLREVLISGLQMDYSVENLNKLLNEVEKLRVV